MMARRELDVAIECAHGTVTTAGPVFARPVQRLHGIRREGAPSIFGQTYYRAAVDISPCQLRSCLQDRCAITHGAQIFALRPASLRRGSSEARGARSCRPRRAEVNGRPSLFKCTHTLHHPLASRARAILNMA